jgi:pSer/pThr/pTyr-binding forkhead associated (FHA) protein
MRIKILLSEMKDERNPKSRILDINQSYCIIGRKSADFILDEPRCSKQHAILYQAYDGGLRLRDMGSTNGTSVNGTKTTDAALKQGDEIRWPAR